jgi:hypothetical protein
VELFDVVADPWERNELSVAEPERVRDLSNALDAWWPGTP